MPLTRVNTWAGVCSRSCRGDALAHPADRLRLCRATVGGSENMRPMPRQGVAARRPSAVTGRLTCWLQSSRWSYSYTIVVPRSGVWVTSVPTAPPVCNDGPRPDLQPIMHRGILPYFVEIGIIRACTSHMLGDLPKGRMRARDIVHGEGRSRSRQDLAST